MAKYEVKDVVCDYGIYEDNKLTLILNSRANALMIKEILEDDEKTGFPTKLFVPRSEYEELKAKYEKQDLWAKLLKAEGHAPIIAQAKQEVSSEIIEEFKNLVINYMTNKELLLTVFKNAIAHAETELKKKYIRDKGE